MRDLELSIPITIDDVDAAWLTAAVGAPVASFTVEPIGVGVGLMGLLYRLAITGDAGTPASVIVKLPVLLDQTRHVALVYRFYEKEVAFYRQLAHESPVGTAHAYCALHDSDSDNFVLVLEDVGHLRAADQVAGCSAADATAAVTALAHHHAAFWNDPRFSTDELAWLPFGSDAPTPEGIRQGFATYWQPFVEFRGERLRPEIRAVGEWLPGAADELLTSVPGHPITLVHGDYRLDNLFFDAAGAVTAIDWQIVTKGAGGYDFAYFVSQSLAIETRRTQIDALAATYLASLRDDGCAYPEDQFWLDVRRTLLFCLAYPVQTMALDLTDPRSASLVHEMADRASSAILELDALQVAPL